MFKKLLLEFKWSKFCVLVNCQITKNIFFCFLRNLIRYSINHLLNYQFKTPKLSQTLRRRISKKLNFPSDLASLTKILNVWRPLINFVLEAPWKDNFSNKFPLKFINQKLISFNGFSLNFGECLIENFNSSCRHFVR